MIGGEGRYTGEQREQRCIHVLSKNMRMHADHRTLASQNIGVLGRLSDVVVPLDFRVPSHFGVLHT